MDSGHDASLPRSLWQVIEPIHAVVYFADEPAAAAEQLGLKGWWMGYFAGRAAPMGTVGAAVVTATFYGFHPRMPERAIPDAWAYASPATVLSTRIPAVADALRSHLGADIETAADDIGAVVRSAADAARGDVAGRPLGAAWASIERTGDPVADLWIDTAVIREHRGDGHVAASVAAGLDGLESNVLLATTGLTNQALVTRARGWSDEEWVGASMRLAERHLVDAEGAATRRGAALREAIEADTDRSAGDPVAAIGADGIDRIAGWLAPLGRRLVDDGLLPTPNPIGLPRPPG